MAVQNFSESSFLLERVDVLAVVSQQLALALEQPDEVMGRAGQEVAGVQLFGKRVEERRVLFEGVDVEHLLRVGQVRPGAAKVGVDAVRGSEVGDAAGRRHTLRGR